MKQEEGFFFFIFLIYIILKLKHNNTLIFIITRELMLKIFLRLSASEEKIYIKGEKLIVLCYLIKNEKYNYTFD